MEKANQKAMMMKIVNWMRKNKDHPGITELNQGWDSNNRMVWNGGKQVTNRVDMFEYNNIGGWGWNWWEHTCTGAGVDGPALKTDKLISTGQWAHLGFACSQRHCFSAQLALHWAFLVALAICPSLLSPVPSLASSPPFWYSPTFFPTCCSSISLLWAIFLSPFLSPCSPSLLHLLLSRSQELPHCCAMTQGELKLASVSSIVQIHAFKARIERVALGRRVTAVVELGEYQSCSVLECQHINMACVFCRCTVQCFKGPFLECWLLTIHICGTQWCAICTTWLWLIWVLVLFVTVIPCGCVAAVTAADVSGC